MSLGMYSRVSAANLSTCRSSVAGRSGLDDRGSRHRTPGCLVRLLPRYAFYRFLWWNVSASAAIPRHRARREGQIHARCLSYKRRDSRSGVDDTTMPASVTGPLGGNLPAAVPGSRIQPSRPLRNGRDWPAAKHAWCCQHLRTGRQRGTANMGRLRCLPRGWLVGPHRPGR
jgi:hypothetical protein